MSASLVGSEMCIRDRQRDVPETPPRPPFVVWVGEGGSGPEHDGNGLPRDVCERVQRRWGQW
eukprot:2953821-Alexandrium_andersonii.AAC.1